MALSMYAASVPVFALALKNLSVLLLKAEAYATAKKIDPSVLISARLYPDMFPLSRQVQIACDVVKGGSARLAGVDAPSFPDTETTFPELQARIQKTIDFMHSLGPDQIYGSETKAVTFRFGPTEMNFEGQAYLLTFVFPNLYFHISIAYAILRHNGLDIGKADYLGAIQ